MLQYIMGNKVSMRRRADRSIGLGMRYEPRRPESEILAGIEEPVMKKGAQHWC